MFSEFINQIIELFYYMLLFFCIFILLKVITKIRDNFENETFPNQVHAQSLFNGNFNEFKSNPEGSLLKWSELGEICSIRFFHKRIIVLNSYDKVQSFFCGQNGAIVCDRTSSYFTSLVSKGYKGILFRHNGKDLEVLRRIIGEFFNPHKNKKIFEEEIILKANTLLTDIKNRLEYNQMANSNLVIHDLKTEYERFMVDLVSPILFGKSINFERFRSTILKGILFNLRNVTMFNVITMLPIWHFLPSSLFNKVLKNTRSLHNFIKDLVEEYKIEWAERMKNREDLEIYKPSDLINCMLFERYKDKTGKTINDDDDIIVSVSTIFNSFFDSVTGMLAWITYYMAKNPNAQQKCREEIESILGQSQPSFLNKQNFKYINACTKESLRCANLVPIVLHVSSKDCFIENYFIPKDTPVIFFILFANSLYLLFLISGYSQYLLNSHESKHF